MTVDDPSFHAAADALAGDGWCIVDDLLEPPKVAALAAECTAMHDARLLLPVFRSPVAWRVFDLLVALLMWTLAALLLLQPMA